METVVLRQWTDSDAEPFAEMNADPAVMRFFPALLTRDESEAMLRRLRRSIDERGWGLWAVDVDGRLAGFAGLSVPGFSAPFMPAVETGWRFRSAFWGRGLACRAAEQALRHGFDQLALDEIVSFTAVPNAPSRRLMERLGMRHDVPGDFDHPRLPEEHALRRHVLYRLSRRDWMARGAAPGRPTTLPLAPPTG